MAVRDVTREGVERAMTEFDRVGRDAFLADHGFRKARGYFLVRGRDRYDSKAIVGVAHAYDRPDLGPLSAQQFSGGDATVAPHLKSLGFDVEGPAPRNPPWAEEELVLALDLYLRGGTPDKKDPGVIELSSVLNALTIHAERPDPERSRNANGVAMKLGNFAALDPNYSGTGMTAYGKRDTEVWARYSSDEDALAEVAAAIRKGAEPPPPAEGAAPRVVVGDVEARKRGTVSGRRPPPGCRGRAARAGARPGFQAPPGGPGPRGYAAPLLAARVRVAARLRSRGRDCWRALRGQGRQQTHVGEDGDRSAPRLPPV